MRVGGNGGNPKKAESHLRRSESTQGAPGVQGGLFGVQEGAVGSQEVAGKWRCMNDFSQKVEDFSRFFEIGSFRPWRRRRWSRLAERSPKPVSPTKTDKGKWVSDDTRKIRRFSRRTCRPGYWPVTPPGARRSQGDLEALARGQRFFSLHQFTLCCCMLFTTLRCQPPPHSHLERPIINPILLE